MKSLKYITYEVTSTTVPFLSKGAGSLSIKCSCNNIESSTINIEDCYVYDNATTNKSSNYTTNNVTLTYNSNGYYQMVTTGSIHTNRVGILLNDLPSSLSVEADMMLISGANPQPRLVIFEDTNYGAYWGASFDKVWSTFRLIQFNGSSETFIEDKPLSYNWNTWYHVKLTYDGSTFSIYIYDTSNNLLQSNSKSTTINPKGIGFNIVADTITTNFKNLKVKPL